MALSLARGTTVKEPSRYQRNLSARRDSFQKRRAHIDYAHAASSFSPQAIAQQAEYAAAWPGVKEGSWKWKGHNIRYQRSGDTGVPVLLVHGFGANADHWRKNTPVIGEWGRCFSIDLLGYGYSDKPDPTTQEKNTIYNFENWADQLEAFVDEVIQEPVVVVCNSIGGMPGLQLAHQAPDKVKAVQLLNISLRALHVSKQPALARPLIAGFQSLLRETAAGELFFQAVAKPQAIKNVLSQAYYDSETVTDELVDCLLKPGMQPGAAKVFLDFISYSSGPLPEALIPTCPRPVGILWGAEDPWEQVELGRKLAEASTVVDYVELDKVGHCPMDESPQRVNPEIKRFVEMHA